MAAAAAAASTTSMMTRPQLLHLFSRFSFLTSLPEVKARIADAVRDKQSSLGVRLEQMSLARYEAVAVTTEIQEEILREMGIDPSFGIGCLGKVNVMYEDDMELMVKFYQFVAKEEMAIDEAELDPIEFAEKIHAQHKLQEQQLKMLIQMRKYNPESQSVILETLRKQLESANFDTDASILTPEQIQEIVEN
ncbi:Os11g0488600 [Oryza sativa Japonica Group]|uniref:Expressed protein n=4 Tax=Oryza TaxID=4527 RepID=Q2R449_ORYSJ|nr:expressed protein [Oryza sativa Japonica Group]KAB8115286.1 hypothetical protein EE612_055605 [Oryza sativa]KAF2910903.1 hypothetical protein DAI22_11g136700 [Oryza sativa Japonica Group]BAF28284.1 Os11g0488600 [Oryza sativa Japonica Group]BAG99207.1 unnamed protein product [Oryza sativa Japonica Group]|eukprot:NP_001067921.1 Os11g0488600 [Oryza sativa Japonica Group]